MSNVTRKSNDTDAYIVVDPLLWFIDMLKDRSNRQDLNKVMLDFYKEETTLASKICSHERLNKPGDQRLKRYKGSNAGKKNLEDIWDLFDQMAHNKTNLTLVTDSTHFSHLKICDINAISLYYGELTKLKAKAKKLEREKVKIEEILKEYATEKVKTNQLLEEQCYMQNLPNVVRTAHWQTGIVSHKILSRSLKLALHSRPRKHMLSLQQTNLIPVSSLHLSQHQPKITSSQQPERKNRKQGETQPNPVQHPMEWTVRQKSMIQNGQL